MKKRTLLLMFGGLLALTSLATMKGSVQEAFKATDAWISLSLRTLFIYNKTKGSVRIMKTTDISYRTSDYFVLTFDETEMVQ